MALFDTTLFDSDLFEATPTETVVISNIYCTIEGYSVAIATIDYLLQSRVTVHMPMPTFVPFWLPLVIFGDMSSAIVCETIAVGTLTVYRNMKTTTRGICVVVGEIGFSIDYELARQEDELFLLTA